MKHKLLFSILSLCGLILSPQLMAQGNSEGFVFTEEEVDEEAELNAVLTNGTKYEQACMREYNTIVETLNNCYKGIIAIDDPVECTKHPDPSSVCVSFYNQLMGKYDFDYSGRKFLNGVLNRSNLTKARPAMTSKEYTNCEAIISRCELVMKWFTGPFRNACMGYHHDFMKKLQRIARFQEYIKDESTKRASDALYHLYKTYDDALLEERLHTLVVTFRNNDEANSRAFFNHFHNTISSSERDSWLCYMVLGGCSHARYRGPEYGVQTISTSEAPWKYLDIRGGRVLMTSTSYAAELSCYMAMLETWTPSELDTLKNLAIANQTETQDAARSMEKMIEETEKHTPQPDNNFKEVVYNTGSLAISWLDAMIEPMADINEFLEKESEYKRDKLMHSDRRKLLESYQRRVETANKKLDAMYEFAAGKIPTSDPLRRSN